MKKFSKKDLPQSVKDYIEHNQIIHIDNCDFIDNWSKGRIKDMMWNRYLYYCVRGFTDKYIVIPSDERLGKLFLKALALHKKAVLEHAREYDYSKGFCSVTQEKNLYASYVNTGINLIECFIQYILIEPLFNAPLYNDLPYPSKVVEGWKSIEEYPTIKSFDDWLISLHGETCKNQWGYERIYSHDFWCMDNPRRLNQDFDDMVSKKFGR